MTKHVKVTNFISRTSGNPVRNQFIITDDNGTTFQSYNSTIAQKRHDGSIVLDRHYWDYSTTTGKYRNQFLGLNKAQTLAAIKAGSIQLADLNGG